MNQLSINTFRSAFNDDTMIFLVLNDKVLEENSTLAQLNWNCVFTTSISDENYSRLFTNDERHIRNIYSENNTQCNLLDRRNLKIVRLSPMNNEFSAESPSIAQRLAKQKMSRMLDIVREMLKYNGYLFVLGYDVTSELVNNALCDLCVELREKSVIFHGGLNVNKDSEIYKILTAKKAFTLDDISDLQLLSVGKDNIDYKESFKSFEFVKIYISGAPAFIKKKDMFYVSAFSIILTHEEIHKRKVPKYLYENYFYTFLKNNALSPQWYGYECGFYSKRCYDDELYQVTIKGLKNPGRENQKPILLVGQTGSGKTSSVLALAYTIFTEMIYPVIYINNAMINFSPLIKGEGFSTQRTKSEEFEVLDQYLQNLENLGAQSALIIWDISAYKRDLDKCLQLDYTLKSRGRNFQLVCTSYNINDSIMTQFKVINSDIILKTSDNPNDDEVRSFIHILENKVKMDSYEIKSIQQFITNNVNGKNLLALFYEIFFEIRPSLSKGVQIEAHKSISDILSSLANEKTEASPMITSMQIAFEKAGMKTNGIPVLDKNENIEDNKSESLIENFLLITSVCSKYGLSIPSRLALSTLGQIDIELIRLVTRIPFFRFDGLDNGDISYRIRTALEAEILLKHYSVSKEREIRLIASLINNVQKSYGLAYNSEVKLMSELLYRIGPNSMGNQHYNSYYDYYPIIIDALRYIRENRSILEPSLVLQEIFLIREYNAKVVKRCSEDQDSCIQELETAIIVGSEMLIRMEEASYNLFLKSALAVEVANSKLRLCDIVPRYQKEYCGTVKHDMEMLWRNSPDDAYSYDVYFRAGRLEYTSSKNPVEKIILLSNMCDVADQLQNANQSIAYNGYIADHLAFIYGEMSSNRADDYFDELIKAGSSAGIHIRIKTLLTAENINLEKTQNLNDHEYMVIEKACSEYLENSEYIAITSSDLKCQYLLLRLKWLMFNKESMFSKYKNTTRMSNVQWKIIRDIAEDIKTKFIDSSQAEPYTACVVLYILALSYAQTNEFQKCAAIITKLRDLTETIYIRSRIFIRHILSDENGHPLEFSGSFLSTGDQAYMGYINIFEISDVYRRGLYYHRNNIKGIPINEGDIHTDFHIGLGYLGLSVMRNQLGGITRG